MKKFLVSLSLIFTCLVYNATAQQGIHAGLVLQPSLVTLRPSLFSSSGNNYSPDFNQTLRTAIGAQVDYHFNPYLGVGVNILYSLQGQKFFVENDLGVYESHYYKFNYLKLPLFLSYNSGGSKARLIGTVGPQLLVLMNAKDVFKSNDISLTDSYAPLNLGFHFGLGMGFFMSRNLMLTVAPNFDITFLNYNFTGEPEQPIYLGRSPVATCFGLQLCFKYVKNEVTSTEVIKVY